MSASERYEGPTEVPRGARPVEDASLADLLSRLSDDVLLLLRQEIALAKTEIKRDVTEAARAGGMFAGAAAFGFFAALLLTFAAAWGLAEVLAPGLAFLIVAVLVAAVAAALAMVGRKRLRELDLVPRTTIDTLQQDKQEISDRMSR